MRLRFSFLALVFAPLLLAGCDPPQARFVYSERTDALIPAVRDRVREGLDEKFGTPKQMVGWQRMPVDFGGYFGTVTASSRTEGSEDVNVLAIDFGERKPKDDEIEQGQELLWTGGSYNLQKVEVVSYDSEAGQLVIRPGLEEPPGVGDAFVVNFGQMLKNGRRLFAMHCLHCHGVSGDGNGPTAKYLNPRPRDYRRGLFKFKSTIRTNRPNNDDLGRIIRQGIPGTYMPSFLLLNDDELVAIVEYVRWLSMRGEYEQGMVNLLYSDYERETFDQMVASEWENRGKSGGDVPSKAAIADELLNDPNAEIAFFANSADQEADLLSKAWLDAQKETAVVMPSVARTESSPDSRARGRVLYMKNCSTCHSSTGRGDGLQTTAYNDKPNTNPPQKYPEPGLFDDWGESINPRDLTRGIYRGGRRPLDLYRRVIEGINGTPMPPFKGKITDVQVWDLVNYVFHIPFERREPVSGGAQHEPTTAAKPAAPQKGTAGGS